MLLVSVMNEDSYLQRYDSTKIAFIYLVSFVLYYIISHKITQLRIPTDISISNRYDISSQTRANRMYVMNV